MTDSIQAADAVATKRPGRPRKDRPAGKRLTFTFEIETPEQRAKLDALGGGAWLRERIDRARAPGDPGTT